MNLENVFYVLSDRHGTKFNSVKGVFSTPKLALERAEQLMFDKGIGVRLLNRGLGDWDVLSKDISILHYEIRWMRLDDRGIIR